jgi:hypothetical protein
MKCPHCHFENPQANTLCTACGNAMRSHPGATSSLGTSTVTADLLLGNEEELKAKAEWLAKRIQAKRALAARLMAVRNAARPPSPAISKIESEMSLILGGIFVGAIALSFTAIYFSMPGHEAETVRGRVSDFVSDARSKAVREARADTRTAAVAQGQAALQVESSGQAEIAPPSSPAPTSMLVADMEPAQPEDVAMPASPSGSNAIPPNTLNAAPSTRAETAPVENSAHGLSRSLHKKHIAKHRARQLAACTPAHQGTKCNPQYVVSFKRFWGPVLEERVYPNRKMTRRARILWDSEGKILEADGTINDKYVVKPKTFAPIPGFPVS